MGRINGILRSFFLLFLNRFFVTAESQTGKTQVIVLHLHVHFYSFSEEFSNFVGAVI